MREKLYALQKTKPVFVTTATHDWCCDNNPRRFDGDKVSNDVETLSSAELYEFYADFGVNGARDTFKTHIGTASYLRDLSASVVLLSLIDDKNGNDHAGYTPDHLKWILDTVRRETAAGKTVIAMQHHLLYPHISPLVTNGACCANRDELREQLADAGLRFLFVGHSHIQRIDKFVSKNGRELYEINVGSLCGYPAPIVNVTVTDDNRLHIVTEHLESFEGADDAQEFLKAHAVQMIDLPLKGILVSREEFGKRLDALGANGKKISVLRPIAKPIAKLLLESDVMSFYKKVNRLTFGKILRKEDAEELADMKVIDIVHNVLLSFLDGGMNRVERDSAYYRLVTGTISIPSRIMKNNSLFRKLNECADAILTGSDPDPEDAII